MLALFPVMLAWVLVHESGHALAVWACGGRVAEFAILAWPPHVTPQGSFTPAELALIAASGPALAYRSGPR